MHGDEYVEVEETVSESCMSLDSKHIRGGERGWRGREGRCEGVGGGERSERG